jgi:hypothetical protein
MENNGYSKTYVDRFKREITKILVLADLRLTADLYPDIISKSEAVLGHIFPDGGCHEEDE